jgi:hypothetical protein
MAAFNRYVSNPIVYIGTLMVNIGHVYKNQLFTSTQKLYGYFELQISQLLSCELIEKIIIT